jgi:hypothetical protein
MLRRGGEDFLEAGEGGEDGRLALVCADHEDVATSEPGHEGQQRVSPALAFEAEGKLTRRDPEVARQRA